MPSNEKNDIFLWCESPDRAVQGRDSGADVGRITEGVMLHWNPKPIRHIPSSAAQTETGVAGIMHNNRGEERT